jgi:H+/Cl- antiporter ClcA
MPTPSDEPPRAHGSPDVLDAIRDDLADWETWLARLVVLSHAAAAGLSIVGFTWLCERALAAFSTTRDTWPWLPFLWTPLCCAAVVAATRRFAPATAGSGIPHVMAALSPRVALARLPSFVSLRLSAWKVGLTAMGLLGGLPIGREGPAVQIAAGVMAHANRWLPERARPRPHSLLIAGGAAGIAAAFNAPLAGVMFAIEELSRDLDERNSGLTVAAIVLAGVVAISAYGNATYFGVIRIPPLSLGFLGPALLVTLAAGLLGGVFSRLLLACLASPPADRFSRWRLAHPIRFAAACGLAIALIGFASGGAAFGSGYESTRALIEGHTDVPLLYVTLRFVATWLAAWSGVPGGLFAPALALGAGVGNDVARLTGASMAAPALIALGMAGFLAAITQAPLTAFVIVMEMVDGHAMVLPLMAAALGASGVARWLSRPLYPALAGAQLRRLLPATPDLSPLPSARPPGEPGAPG